MTEEEWLACEDLWTMLNKLGSKLSERKSRLFAVACCRRAWHLIPVEESRQCVEAAERFADGLVSQAELSAAIDSSCRACDSEWRGRSQLGRRWGVIEQEVVNAVGRVHRTEGGGRNGTYLAVQRTLAIEQVLMGSQHGDGDGYRVSRSQLGALEREEEIQQASLLREIFGNPFRPVAFSPEWCTDTAVALARTMYDSRDFGAMPILADALQDAGCDDEDILSHCRDPKQVHVRGCWVVDLVLGKG
jgi:hypothetical protein